MKNLTLTIVAFMAMSFSQNKADIITMEATLIYLSETGQIQAPVIDFFRLIEIQDSLDYELIAKF
jgi:hypothetical protein